MGTACIRWQDIEDQLQMMHSRDDRVVKPAAWWDEDEVTKDIVGDRDEKTGGTWFACSKQGRVALLVNVTRLTPFRNAGAELLTVKLLKGKMTPKKFANELEMDKSLSLGLTFNLVVADIHSKSMFYISKKTQNYKEVDEIKEVGPGQYVITSAGIYDLTCPENKRLNDNFNEVLKEYKNKGLSEKEFVGKLMSDDQVMGNNGTALLDVKRTGKATFFEIYLEKGRHIYRQFNFDIE